MRAKYLIVLCAITVIVSLACVALAFRGASPAFQPDTLPAARVGTAYETGIHVTENDTPLHSFSVSQGELPAGLELIWEDYADTARISGVPEQAGTFTFTLRVECLGTNVQGETGEKEYSIVVEK